MVKNKREIVDSIQKNFKVIKKFFGIDNVYASITSSFLELFRMFPDICLINNIKGTINYGVYKGLRKLKGDDIVLIDAGKEIKDNFIKFIFQSDKPYLLSAKKEWCGIAYIPQKEVYYVIKSFERNPDGGIITAFNFLRNTYGIEYAFIDINTLNG